MQLSSHKNCLLSENLLVETQ